MTVEQREQLSEIFVTKGYSFSAPIFDENGKPDNDKSRRVEVKFYIKVG